MRHNSSVSVALLALLGLSSCFSGAEIVGGPSETFPISVEPSAPPAPTAPPVDDGLKVETAFIKLADGAPTVEIHSFTASGTLSFTGYFEKPVGSGPFPAAILNHGKGNSAAGWQTYGIEFAKVGILAIQRDYNSNDTGETHARQALKLVSVLDKIAAANASRIAMYGHSMGSATTSLALSRFDFPNKARIQIGFWSAGGMLIDGLQGYPIYQKRDELLTAADLAKIGIPVHFYHGALDTTIPVAASRAVDAELTTLGKAHSYTEFPDLDHSLVGTAVPLVAAKYLEFLATAPAPSPAPSPVVNDALGLAVESADACLSDGKPYGPCKVVELQCDGMSALKAEIIVTEPAPTAAYKGTIVFGTGGSGGAFYRGSGPSSDLFTNLSNAGYRLIDRRWQDGWFGGAGGVRKGACRYATLVTYLHQKYGSAGAPFCGTGNSGGAGELLHSVTHYGRDSLFDLVVPSGGPAVTRLDYACVQPTDPAWLNQCQDLIASKNWLSPDANGVLGAPLSWEATVPCSLSPSDGVCTAVASNPTVDQLRQDSVLSVDAKTHFTNTYVYSINGTEDSQISPAVGLLFNSVVTSSKSNVVVDSPHTIYNDIEGAAQIERAMKEYCIYRH